MIERVGNVRTCPDLEADTRFLRENLSLRAGRPFSCCSDFGRTSV